MSPGPVERIPQQGPAAPEALPPYGFPGLGYPEAAPRLPVPTGLIVVLALAALLVAGEFAYLGIQARGPGSPAPPIGNPAPVVYLTGQVLAGAGGSTPVDNAIVYAEAPGSATATFTTGMDGKFWFNATLGATYTLWATLGIHWGTVWSPNVTEVMPSGPATVTVNLFVPASDITGTVLDNRTGLPIAGATMSITDPFGSPWCCQYTGGDGVYLLWTITPGTYAVSAAASGYVTGTANVYVGSTNTTAFHDFRLAP